MAKLTFALEIEDGWPPVAAEGLPCTPKDGGFIVESPPLFIKELSAGDVIRVISEENGQVTGWVHLSKSPHSTVWLMALNEFSLDEPLSQLRGKGCNTVGFQAYALAAVDVPTNVAASEIDEIFSGYSGDQLSIAYPSWRHAEPGT